MVRVLSSSTKKIPDYQPSSHEDTSGQKPKIFVAVVLDELGLDPYEFRLYGHIARRRKCFASLNTISTACCMSVRRVQYALQVLECAGLIQKQHNKGRTNIFSLTPASSWLKPLDSEKVKTIRARLKAGESLESIRDAFTLPTTTKPEDLPTIDPPF